MGTAKHWLDEPRNVRLLRRLALAVLVLVLAAELAVQLKPHFAVEGLFGFHAWFGFFACIAMIGLAKGLALLLKRPDTYYGDGDD
ncbi:MAG: hypothetical protein JNK40_12795 [Chromatiales bacterium]|nr:hypothetical protein [Chromatiales bacterium]